MHTLVLFSCEKRTNYCSLIIILFMTLIYGIFECILYQTLVIWSQWLGTFIFLPLWIFLEYFFLLLFYSNTPFSFCMFQVFLPMSAVFRAGVFNLTTTARFPWCFVLLLVKLDRRQLINTDSGIFCCQNGCTAGVSKLRWTHSPCTVEFCWNWFNYFYMCILWFMFRYSD